jgi:hypothetical protein
MKYKWHDELLKQAKKMRADLEKNGFNGKKLSEKQIKLLTGFGVCQICGVPWVVIEESSTQDYGQMKPGCEHNKNLRLSVG